MSVITDVECAERLGRVLTDAGMEAALRQARRPALVCRWTRAADGRLACEWHLAADAPRR